MAERLNRRGTRPPAEDDLAADDVDRLRTGLSMGFGSEMDPRSREPETHCSAEWVCKHFVLNVVAVVFTLVIFLFTAMMFPPCVAACALCFRTRLVRATAGMFLLTVMANERNSLSFKSNAPAERLYSIRPDRVGTVQTTTMEYWLDGGPFESHPLPHIRNLVRICWQAWASECVEEKCHLEKYTEPSLYQSICASYCKHDAAFECNKQWMREFKNGEPQDVKIRGRWPFLRIGLFCEVFSSAVMYAGFVINVVYMIEYSMAYRDRRRSSKFQRHTPFMVWYITANIAFLCAAVFHTCDIPLTEKADYFAAAVASFGLLYCASTYVLSINSRRMQWIVGLPFCLGILWYIHYQATVPRFSYSLHTNLCGGMMIVSLAMWVGWSVMNLGSQPHAWMQLVGQLLFLVALGFEIVDFPPVFLVADSHSLWHFVGLFCCALRHGFQMSDLRLSQDVGKV